MYKFVGILLPNVLMAAFASVAYAAGNESNSVLVKVTDSRGKPAAGAELWLEKAGVKGAKKTLADEKGQFTFKNLPSGGYKISAFDYKTPAAGATSFQTSKGSVTAVISLDKISREAMTSKTKKKYVWVAGGETGSHIGGGKWVPIEENAGGTGANPLEKKSGAIFNPVQNPDMRAWEGYSR